MKISENIREAAENRALWKPFRNRSYPVQIQSADPAHVYNVPERAGVVYNQPEDAYETVPREGYVITGLMGEMWVVPPAALPKYDIAPEKITPEPQSVLTRETDAIYLGLCIPAETEFTLVTDYGREVLLRGNRPGIPHGAGDWILVFAHREKNRILPDEQDLGRIVNGSIFSRLYQPYTES